MRWVHVVLGVPPASLDQAAAFWSQALGWPLGAPSPGRPRRRSFRPERGDPYVHLQAAEGESRVHLEFEVDDVSVQRDRAIALGASAMDDGDGGGALRSPGGLPFGLIGAVAHPVRPPAVAFGPEVRTRLVQVCVDSPGPRHDAEVAFWRAFTRGRRWAPSGSPEFAGKLYPEAGAPIQLLFQRLGPDDGARDVRAHLDLGASDREADAARLVALGATQPVPGRGWIALRDPNGMVFCTTGNPPD